MATGKRYFWMKLKESFMTSDAVDFLMSQPNGAQYVVLYQMLCLKTINTAGKLVRQIGEVIIPYDVQKIKRDCKYFSEDTINIALQLYAKLGLVYRDIDGVLSMTDHESLVGSETDWAGKQRRQRGQSSLPTGDNVPTNVPSNVPTEIDNRDRDIEIESEDIRNRDIEGKRIQKKADAFSDFAGDDAELLAVLQEFEVMRKKIKSPMTDKAKTLLIGKLKEFPSDTWIPVLNQSIFNGWKSIYPLKHQGDRNQVPSKSEDTISTLRALHQQYEDGEP